MSLHILQASAAPGNYGHLRSGHTPRAIVNHLTQGGEPSAWFANPAAGVSSHYSIGADGTIRQHVREMDTAYANGNLRAPNVAAVPWLRGLDHNPNLDTISIEWEGLHSGGTVGPVGNGLIGLQRGTIRRFWQPTAAQWANGVALHRAILARYGWPATRATICRHSDFDSLTRWYCPGEGFPLAQLLTELNSKK